MHIIPVILSGGSGTRLWPLSRAQFPKQFLPLTSEHTMIQETVLRLAGLNTAAPIVVCNESHRFIVAEQLAEIGITDSSVILEPVGKNTAPAIAAAALQAMQTDSSAVLVVLAADHCIRDAATFRTAIQTAVTQAEQGALVTFGVVPAYAETGYGYIKTSGAGDVRNLERFVEKPNKETAESYIADGGYFWNSGMFVFTAARYIEELKKYDEPLFTLTEQSFTHAVRDNDFIRLEKESFAQISGTSIDYAVMEKTTHGAVVPLDAGWNDVGSWSSLWDVNHKDTNGNVTKGDVIAESVTDSYLYSDSRLITALGVNNLVIVDTKDTLLVASKDKVQDVKNIVTTLKEQNRTVASENREGYRPWGTYDVIEKGEGYKVKHITVKPGAKLSVQMHYHRAEHWIVVSGTAKVRNGDSVLTLAENESTYIPIGAVHSLENPGKIPLELIEVQSGHYLEEDDIVRLEDKYGRC